MADLIAQGATPDQRWRRTLPDEGMVVLGRTAEHWTTPWDDHVSRRHVELQWRTGQLEVRRLPDARNPVFFRGQAKDVCLLRPGDHFVIGSTTFTLVNELVQVTADAPRPADQQSFDSRELRRRPFRNVDQRLEVLSRLPEVIASATNDTELDVQLVNLLLSGVRHASAVAIVAQQSVEGGPRLVVRHWDRRGPSSGEFGPSEHLIREALSCGATVLHVWQRNTTATTNAPGGGAAESGFGTQTNQDWAFCTPLAGSACRGWALYVAGRTTAPEEESPDEQPMAERLQDDVKFTELAAASLSSLRDSQWLARQQAGLSQFFSPVVLNALSGRDPEEVLAPREAEVAVLFCDLRGFSRTSARAAHDLLGLLRRVSGALGVMTRHILAEGGVIGDFHGDSAMGFWGWQLAQPDAAERACRAALKIRSEFADAAAQPDHPLADFRIGIGVASGRAVAGKIGSVDQVKVTVFGPVVNLAARLEALTKVLRAPILIDSATAEIGRSRLSADAARIRRVAVVRPPGLDQPVEVSELLPSQRDEPLLTDEHLAAYETALAAFTHGDWAQAFRLLHQVPAEDRVKDFLTVFIAQHNRTPPASWDGVISIADK